MGFCFFSSLSFSILIVFQWMTLWKHSLFNLCTIRWAATDIYLAFAIVQTFLFLLFDICFYCVRYRFGFIIIFGFSAFFALFVEWFFRYARYLIQFQMNCAFFGGPNCKFTQKSHKIMHNCMKYLQKTNTLCRMKHRVFLGVRCSMIQIRILMQCNRYGIRTMYVWFEVCVTTSVLWCLI